MPQTYFWLFSVSGSLLTSPLVTPDTPGRVGVERAADIADLLGRADLLDGAAPPPPIEPEPPDSEPAQPAEELPEKVENEDSAPLIPQQNSAGDGPAEVHGVVFDRDGNGIPGVIITLIDLGGFQTRTDTKGEFQITGLPAEGVRAELLKPGYTTKVEVLQLKADAPTKVRLGMELKPIELADGETLLETREIVVDYEEEAFGGVTLGATDTPSFVSGIGKEEFAKQAVSNAADAIGRVSGANIVDGKYAVVRGLADRYVTTSFNNGAITSADPSRKAVQLDLFPTSVLEGIGVSKTYDASMPGDFGGGAINIATLAMPEEQFLTLKTKIGWNSNLESPFFRNSKRKLDFWGDVDNPFPRERISDANGNILGGSGGADPDPVAAAAWTDLVRSTSLIGRESKPRPDQGFGITYGDRFEWNDDTRLGVIASFSHSRKDRMQLERVRARPGIERFWQQDDYSSEVDWGYFLSAQLEFAKHHKLRAAYFRKRVASDEVNFATDVDYDVNGIRWGVAATRQVRDGIPEVEDFSPFIPGYGADAFYKGEFWQTETVVRDLDLFQLSGEHQFGDRGLKLSWGYTRNRSSESRPNSSVLNYGVLDFTDPRIAEAAANPLQPLAVQFNRDFNLGFNNPQWDNVRGELISRMVFGGATEQILDATANNALANAPVFNPDLGRIPTFGNTEYTGDSPGAMFSEILNQRIEEETDELFADVVMPFDLGEDREFRLKGGFRSSVKKRRSRGQRYQIDANTLDPVRLYTPGGLGTGAVEDPDRIPEGFDGSENGITVEDGNDKEVRNFDGSSTLLGAYVGGELEWGDYLLSAGLRHESETRGFFTLPAPLNLFDAANKRGEVTNSINIPSLSLTRSFADDQFTIGAYFSRTVARPTFFEFLPARTVEQDTGFERRGEFGLRDTTITNLDLTFEWNITPESRLSFAPFYKKLEDPIISVVRRSERFVGFQNAERGTLKGLELEWDIADFKPFTFKGNYTFIEPELIANINIGNAGIQPVSLRYPNQPEHILNVALGYEDEESGWSSNLIYNFTGENALFLRIRDDDADVVTPDFHSLDFNIRKKFQLFGNDTEVALTVKNVLDSKAKIIFDGGGPGFENEIFDIRNSGRSFELEFKTTF